MGELGNGERREGEGIGRRGENEQCGFGQSTSGASYEQASTELDARAVSIVRNGGDDQMR